LKVNDKEVTDKMEFASRFNILPFTAEIRTKLKEEREDM
jgi:hypothetical protein